MMHVLNRKKRPLEWLLSGLKKCNKKRKLKQKGFSNRLVKKSVEIFGMEYFIAGTVLYILFFVMCYINTGTDKKNMTSYYSYPNVIQEQIKKDADLKKFIPKEKNYLQSFISNFVLFFIVFIVVGVILKCFDFKFSFIFFLIMGEGLNLFDLLIIDCCWFVRSKRTRFNNIGTPEMYVEYRKHFISFLNAVPIFIAVAFTGASVLSFF